MIILTPPPGTHSDVSEVTISGPEGYQVIVSNNGPDPVLVRTVASSDKDGTDRPYIQYMDDGRGRVILDGAFGKYYNSQASTNKTTYANTFLKNCIDYISPVENPRILFLGDRIAPEDGDLSYSIKGTSGSAFRTFFETFCNNFDFTYDIKDALDYNGELDFGLDELTNYQVLFFMGSRNEDQDSIPVVSERLARAIATFREEGKGVYLCTDHNSFFYNNNIILSYITDAQFEGSYDFSPGTTVAYNRALHGDSPLFRGLSDNTIMRGSGSDSSVQQNIELPLSLPVTVPIDEGHNAFKLGVIDPSGNMQFLHYYYGVNESPVIELTDNEGNVIDGWEQTNIRQRRVYFKYNDTGIGNCTGYVRAGNTVIGTFEDCPPGPLDVTWLNTEFTISALGELVTMTGDKNLDISVEFYEPFEFRIAWNFNRFIPPENFESTAKYFHALNRNEFKVDESNIARLFKKASDVIYNPSIAHSTSASEYIANIRHALTVQMPNMLYTPSASEIITTFKKYIGGTGSSRDADFVLKDGAITNLKNTEAACHLVNPDFYPCYQSVILSSTSTDDDIIGVVFGMRETSTRFILYAVEWRLNVVPHPEIRLRRTQFIKPVEPGIPGIFHEEGHAADGVTTPTLTVLTNQNTYNPGGFKGWQSPGWKDGVHVSVEFINETLTVRMNPPGEKPSDNYEISFSVSSDSEPHLKDVQGASGLMVFSQPGSKWSNYAIIRLEE